MRKRWDAVLDRLPPGPVKGVEVGVWLGSMSAKLLKRPDLMLWMVDIEPRPQAVENTQFAANRRKTLWLPSVEAAQIFDDGSLDFVFIDADHSYEAVKADIAAWGPKVKPNGVLCGHDYGKTQRDEVGVTRAVDEIFPDAEIDADYTWFQHRLTVLALINSPAWDVFHDTDHKWIHRSAVPIVQPKAVKESSPFTVTLNTRSISKGRT